jgi:hypothetical protein
MKTTGLTFSWMSSLDRRKATMDKQRVVKQAMGSRNQSHPRGIVIVAVVTMLAEDPSSVARFHGEGKISLD